jgi:acyl carrier protein
VEVSPDRILNFLSDDLGVDTAGITPDALLFSTGVIDSFGLVTLMTFLEGEYNIRIKPADVNLDNFDSISRILDYVQRSA